MIWLCYSHIFKQENNQQLRKFIGGLKLEDVLLDCLGLFGPYSGTSSLIWGKNGLVFPKLVALLSRPPLYDQLEAQKHCLSHQVCSPLQKHSANVVVPILGHEEKTWCWSNEYLMTLWWLLVPIRAVLSQYKHCLYWITSLVLPGYLGNTFWVWSDISLWWWLRLLALSYVC